MLSPHAAGASTIHPFEHHMGFKTGLLFKVPWPACIALRQPCHQLESWNGFQARCFAHSAGKQDPPRELTLHGRSCKGVHPDLGPVKAAGCCKGGGSPRRQARLYRAGCPRLRFRLLLLCLCGGRHTIGACATNHSLSSQMGLKNNQLPKLRTLQNLQGPQTSRSCAGLVNEQLEGHVSAASA